MDPLPLALVAVLAVLTLGPRCVDRWLAARARRRQWAEMRHTLAAINAELRENARSLEALKLATAREVEQITFTRALPNAIPAAEGIWVAADREDLVVEALLREDLRNAKDPLGARYDRQLHPHQGSRKAP